MNSCGRIIWFDFHRFADRLHFTTIQNGVKYSFKRDNVGQVFNCEVRVIERKTNASRPSTAASSPARSETSARSLPDPASPEGMEEGQGLG